MAEKLWKSLLAWQDTTPEASFEIHKETLENGTERYKGWIPSAPELEPRYGETQRDVVESLQRQHWTYYSSGNDAELANKEK